MRVVLLGRDLITASRIAESMARAGLELLRVEDPADLPRATLVDVLLVDWGDRRPDWGTSVPAWCSGAPESAGPTVILFGPHTDLMAHAEAQAAGLGPMRARSKLFADLPNLLG